MAVEHEGKRWKDKRNILKDKNDSKLDVSDNIHSFLDELEAIFDTSELVYTSGRRGTKSSYAGKSEDKSKHFHGNAIDIAPNHRVFYFLQNTVEGMELLNRYGLGILDETDPNIKKDTGATGDHFHIGIDPGLVSKNVSRLNTYKKSGEITLVKPYLYKDKAIDFSTDFGDVSSGGITYNFNDVEIESPNIDVKDREAYIPYKEVTNVPDVKAAEVKSIDEIEKELNRAMKKDEKVEEFKEEVPELAELEQEQKQREAFLEAFSQQQESLANQEKEETTQGEQYEIPISEIEIDDSISFSLPEIPELFSIGEIDTEEV